MKAIILMFDTLNRHLLPPYGNDWVHAPNFTRLAEKTVTFDTCYAGSLPCMPARREMHTGRYNFLHRGWGPIEPYDDSMPDILKKSGVYTHMVSDHYHYWEDGGSTYHNRYSSWEFARGQEGDLWKGEVADPAFPEDVIGRTENLYWRPSWVNRKYFIEEEDYPQAQAFAAALEFLETNRDEDNWLLQLEVFDPHEPYLAPEKYRQLYPHKYSGPHFKWPTYQPANQPEEQIEHIRYEHAALLSMCDAHLGKMLDYMDREDLWEDTLLIVCTDHGFLLGEHGWIAKNLPPCYQEIAHTPLFVWDPRSKKRGVRNGNLVQTIDIPPTLYEYFGVDIPDTVQGHPLSIPMTKNKAVRAGALFGLHGGQVNCTDGRYVYMRTPVHPGMLHNYGLMPTHIVGFFDDEELSSVELAGPFSFTKGLKVMRTMARPAHETQQNTFPSLLFDLKNDPGEEHPLNDPEIERRMAGLMVQLMVENDAPPEQFTRLGFDVPATVEAGE
jgi:arylsulfatase A-like enzyme